jgi:two-component system, OmpR family, response regulator QseB
MRLLLIEDEKELAAALAVALSKHGIVTDQTARLADAFELTLQNDYDASSSIVVCPTARG